MKIIRFDSKGHCQFIYFNWRKFKFETTCWAHTIGILWGKTKHKKHLFIGISMPPRKEDKE
jgi:hypothetical protein